MRKHAIILCALLMYVGHAFSQTELLQNGNFSQSNSGWQVTGNFQYDQRFNNWHSNPGYAYIATIAGQYDNLLSGQLYQDFFVPAGTPSLTISFWFSIITAEGAGAGQNDTCNVKFVDPGNANNGIVLMRLSNQDRNSAYAKATITVSGFQAAATWRLIFSARTNGSNPTLFRIDDVSVVSSKKYYHRWD